MDMEEKIAPKGGNIKNTIKIFVFVCSILVFGVSVSYAYFTANMVGNSTTSHNQGGVLDVTATLSSVPVINAAQLALIEPTEYLTKGEKVTFSVTNTNNSTLKAKYTIKLVEMSLSKNLFSKYFKWALIVNTAAGDTKTYTGDFADATITPEGTEITADDVEVTGLTKVLISDEDAIALDINSTDNLSFYIWLENDAHVDQLYLTNGTFTGKLSLDAVPTK